MKKVSFIALVVLISCNKKEEKMSIQKESPLATVVKLISAESMGYIEVAKEYIDVKMVYSKHVNDSIDYDKLFADQVKFMSSTTDSRKMTNHFKYFNYEISETQEGETAEVKFESKDKKASLERIVYSLENRNNQWVVVGIDYEKK
jgi:hypothetical protein